MPEKQSRRKRFTPQAKSGADDAWQRTLDIMGLEPLSGNQEQTTIANGMSSPAPEASLAQGSEKKTEISILDLPSETQNEIFKHVSRVSYSPVLPFGRNLNTDNGSSPAPTTSLPFPLCRSISEPSQPNNYIEASISSFLMTKTHQTNRLLMV